MATRMHRHPAGYTLLEVAVASAMAGILTTAGLSAFAMFNRQRVRLERSTTADDTAKVVLQYLVRETQRIGGATLRPWQAMAIEQDPCAVAGGVPCVRGDRVTFAFADERALFTSCKVKALSDTTLRVDQVQQGTDTACCNQFRIDSAGAIVVAPITSLKNTHVMLSSAGTSGTSEERYRAVTYANDVGDGANCTFNIVTSAQVRPLSSRCEDAAGSCVGGRPANAVFASGGLFSRQANAIPITVATAYIGCTTTSCANTPEDLGLFLFADRNGGVSTTLTVDADDDNFAVSPNIIDLQVAPGYDLDGDGELEESLDGADDDYSGNKSPLSSAAPFTDFAIPAGATLEDPRRLRMLAIGIMSAIKVNDHLYTSTAQLPGGSPIVATGLHLRALSSKAAFRSLNLLE